MSTVVAFAQKKEIRKAENAVEDGEFVEAKNLLSQAEPLLGEARDKDKVTFYLTKGKAYYGTGEGVPAADLMTAAEAYKQAQALGAEEAQQGIAQVSMALVNLAIADQQADGIDGEVIFPNGPALLMWSSSDVEFVKAHQDWCDDFVLDIPWRPQFKMSGTREVGYGINVSMSFQNNSSPTSSRLMIVADSRRSSCTWSALTSHRRRPT